MIEGMPDHRLLGLVVDVRRLSLNHDVGHPPRLVWAKLFDLGPLGLRQLQALDPGCLARRKLSALPKVELNSGERSAKSKPSGRTRILEIARPRNAHFHV